MIVQWEVDDGYCGKSRPQTTDIDDGDLAELETEEEREEYINQMIDEDFEQKITWHRIQ